MQNRSAIGTGIGPTHADYTDAKGTSEPTTEGVLEEALRHASQAGRWDVVAKLADELRARREVSLREPSRLVKEAAAGNVVPLPSATKGGHK